MVFRLYAKQPLGVTRDPEFLHLGHSHRRSLAFVLHGIIAGGGFTALIAGPGMRKNTVLGHLLEKVRGAAGTTFLVQSQRSPHELLKDSLTDLGIEDDGNSLVEMHQQLNKVRVPKSVSTRLLVVVSDEGQNLAEPTPDALRRLSNFESTPEKLIQNILVGHCRWDFLREASGWLASRVRRKLHITRRGAAGLGESRYG